MPDRFDSPVPPAPASVPDAADTREFHRLAGDAARRQRELNAELDLSRQLGRQFGAALTSAFAGIAVQGRSLGDVIGGLAQKMSKLALTTAFEPLEAAFGSILQGLVAGTARGGSAMLPTGTPLPVTGEGAIAAPAALPAIAMSSLAAPGGGTHSAPEAGIFQGSAAFAQAAGMHVTFNVSTPDAESFRRSETQLAAMLARSVGTGQRNL